MKIKNLKNIKSSIILILLMINSTFIYCQGESQKIKEYDSNNKFIGYEYFLEENLICESVYDSISNREIFVFVNEAPFFGDSITDILKYVYNNLKYPATDVDVVGRVYVQFIVETNGELTNFKILRSLQSEFDNEAIEVFKKMPKWTPGKCNGIKVPVYFNVPIKFELN